MSGPPAGRDRPSSIDCTTLAQKPCRVEQADEEEVPALPVNLLAHPSEQVRLAGAALSLQYQADRAGVRAGPGVVEPAQHADSAARCKPST